jgi:hypothetical protein
MSILLIRLNDSWHYLVGMRRKSYRYHRLTDSLEEVVLRATLVRLMHVLLLVLILAGGLLKTTLSS